LLLRQSFSLVESISSNARLSFGQSSNVYRYTYEVITRGIYNQPFEMHFIRSSIVASLWYFLLKAFLYFWTLTFKYNNSNFSTIFNF
jgi:hypothetical protein